MDKVSIYIKKLIALALSAFLMLLLLRFIPLVPALAFGFLVLSFLHFNITGEKPAYLFGLSQSDAYLEEKGGFWLLFRWILLLFGFLYDLVVWTVNGVYVLFLIFIDILLLIKTIIFWIIHAVIWFLALFVPPLVFIYRMVIHYLILWPWWIYRLTFRNAGLSVNGNFFRIAYRGAALSIFILLLFYGAGILTGAPVIGAFGIVFCILPVIWAFGEISAMRFENRWNAGFSDVRFRFRSGFDAVRSVLFYLTIMLAGILIEIVLDMLGWIPGGGLSLLGITLNINTFVTLVLLFVFVILLFASLMIPPHVVYDPHFSNRLSESVKFLGVIGRRFLRYLLSLIPATFFSAVLAVIPAIIVALAVYITLNVKNAIIDARITRLHHAAAVMEGVPGQEMQDKADRLEYFKDFPANIFTGFTDIKALRQKKISMEESYSGRQGEMNRGNNAFRSELDSLTSALRNRQAAGDTLASSEMDGRIQGRTDRF